MYHRVQDELMYALDRYKQFPSSDLKSDIWLLIGLCDPYRKDKEGDTVLSYALRVPNMHDVIKELVKVSDTSVIDINGLSLIEQCEEQPTAYKHEYIDILKEHRDRSHSIKRDLFGMPIHRTDNS